MVSVEGVADTFRIETLHGNYLVGVSSSEYVILYEGTEIKREEVTSRSDAEDLAWEFIKLRCKSKGKR